MVRIIEIKQLFSLINIILISILFISLVVYFYVIFNYNPERRNSNPEGGFKLKEDVVVQNTLPNIDSKSLSAKLSSSGLFGDAGRWSEDDVPKEPVEPVKEPEPPSDKIEDTQLNLKLKGTIATSPRDKFACAFIENLDKRITAAFAVGQEVDDQVILEEVYKKEVILLNRKVNPPRRERLKLEDTTLELTKTESRTPPPIETPKEQPRKEEQKQSQIDINRDEIIQDFFASYADIATRVKPELYRDKEGKVIGVTAKNIGQIPLAQKLGFKDGDVLVSVDGETVDSEDKIMELIKKYSSADLSQIKITILRNGNPMDIIFRIHD